MATTVTEKATAPLNFQLLEGGSALDITGATLVLLLTDALGVDVTTSGKTAIVTAASGLVKFTPGSTDLVAANSPYQVRWKITDAGGSIKYFPSGLRDSWEVAKE